MMRQSAMNSRFEWHYEPAAKFPPIGKRFDGPNIRSRRAFDVALEPRNDACPADGNPALAMRFDWQSDRDSGVNSVQAGGSRSAQRPLDTCASPRSAALGTLRHEIARRCQRNRGRASCSPSNRTLRPYAWARPARMRNSRSSIFAAVLTSRKDECSHKIRRSRGVRLECAHRGSRS